MLIKKYILVSIALVLSHSLLLAQTTKKVTIEHATVFLNGAELESSSKINLTTGESEVLFTNIAGNVNQQSLNVGATNGAVVQSAVFQNNYLTNDNLSPRAQELQDSIEYLDKTKGSLNSDLQVVNEQIAILNQNRKVTGDHTGLSVTELQKMLDLVKNRMRALFEERTTYTDKIAKVDERIKKLRQQLTEEKQKGFQPGGQLLVKFYTKKATTSDITISYVVPNAGWSPSYDVRVDKVNSPVNIAYKAHVFQNSGVSWDKVKLTLSTGNPNEGAQAPVLNTWFLNFNQPPTPRYINSSYSNGVEKMPTRNTSSMANTTAGAYPAADANGISIGGARGNGTLYYVDGVQVVGNRDISLNTSGGINDYTLVDNSGINSIFDIDLDYTIPSDGKTHNVAIKTHTLPAAYRYYAVPKLDRDAFLQAQITDWEDLSLLPGPTNIFFEGTYVGQGYIDMRSVKDTMNISLGRDKKVIIRRERDKDLRSVRTIGSNIRETFVYTMSIRNTRNQPLDITILDQFPISQDNSIEIEDLKYDGADYNKTTGTVTWKIGIKANATEKVQLGFTIKYPKGKTINLY